MKRVVIYLHEYMKGKRDKNMGFIRMDIHKEETHISVFLQNVVKRMDKGEVFLLIRKNGLVGISVGEICIKEGLGDVEIGLKNRYIKDSRFSVWDIVGVAIILQEGGYIAGCWKEEFNEDVSLGEFGVWNAVEKELIQEEKTDFEDEDDVEIKEMVESLSAKISYQKIELSEIHSLPSANWHLCNNSFLLHGFWNYGYLVLKTEIKKDEKKAFLGVPGIFEKPEMVMAVMFGFTDFETAPLEIEKNQQPKTGDFGCWFVELENIGRCD